MSTSSPAGSPQTPELTLDEVLTYFSGALLLMAGRREGLNRLDCSADGFWRSFSAIAVALPPLALSWIEFEAVNATGSAERNVVAVYTAHAVADILAWLLPVAVLLLAASPLSLRRKIAPLVVATNWGGALLIWAFTPFWILLLLFGHSDLSLIVGTLASIVSIVLMVRLASAALGGDLGTAIAVTGLMILCSLVSYGVVMDMTGVKLI